MMESDRFDTNLFRFQAVKLHSDFDHFKYSLRVNKKKKENISRSLSQVHLDWINMNRNDLISKRPLSRTGLNVVQILKCLLLEVNSTLNAVRLQLEYVIF